MDLRTKRLITEDEFYRFMSYHGYSAELIEALLANTYKPLPTSALRKLSRLGLMDREAIKRQFEMAGYWLDNAQRMADLVVNEPVHAVYDDLVRAMEDKYIDGAVTYGELYQIWTEAGYTEAEKDLRTQLLSIKLLKVRTLTPSQIKRALAAGLMEEAEALRYLEELGYSRRDATILLAI